MNNLDSALVEMAALAAKWRGENENNFGCFVRSDEQFSGILRGRKMAADELDALRTHLAGNDNTLLQNESDFKVIQDFLTIGRTMKPVGHWPGDGLYLAIDRVMTSCVPNWNSPIMGG